MITLLLTIFTIGLFCILIAVVIGIAMAIVSMSPVVLVLVVLGILDYIIIRSILKKRG